LGGQGLFVDCLWPLACFWSLDCFWLLDLDDDPDWLAWAQLAFDAEPVFADAVLARPPTRAIPSAVERIAILPVDRRCVRFINM
jgi:hypothetical protein